MAITEQLSSIVFVLFVVQLTRAINIEDPKNLLYIRLVYLASQIVLLSVSYYTFRRIKKENNQAKVKVTEPPKPFTNDPPTETEVTVEEYDRSRVFEFLKQSVISILILLFLHLKFNFVQPLLIQAVLSIKNAAMLPIFQIHVFNKTPEGALKRPFKPPASPFAEMMEGAQTGMNPQEELTKSEKKKLKKAFENRPELLEQKSD